MQPGVSCLLIFLAALASAPSSGEGAASSATANPNAGAVQVAMKNVVYHYTAPIAVHIVQLQGELTPNKPGGIVVFDDKDSFTLTLSSAEIAISCDALARVMNEHVFASPDAPIKNLSMSARSNHLTVKGQLHQKGDVPFETAGSLAAEPDGRIRFHAEHVKAAHLPVKGLLTLLGIDLAKLVNTNQVKGVSFDKDDLILNPSEILPAPHIKGQVTSVRLEGDQIVQDFGSPNNARPAPKLTGNYMAYHNSDLRFGKLTMTQADMTLIDMDPQDPFDFYLDHYRDQLVAGYTKTTPEFGLRVYLRDYSKLHKPQTHTHAGN